MIIANRFCEYLEYNRNTGIITWRKQKGYKIKPGDLAGHINTDGYWKISIFYHRYEYARVCWLLHYGEWPNGEIDHIDGNKSNNKIDNLRDISHSSNTQNKRRPKRTNKLGILGVYQTASGRYSSQICVNGERIYLGLFNTGFEAYEAYVMAKRKYHSGCTI